jgi:hypothetical protein
MCIGLIMINVRETANDKLVQNITEQVSEAVMLYTCIWEVPVSNQGQVTGHSDWGFHCFPHSLQANARIAI